MFIDPLNLNVAQNLTSILSFLSLVCSLFFVCFYLFSTRTHKFYIKLVFYLQISDSILAFGLLLCLLDNINDPTLCRLQSFLIQYGSISSILWRTVISIILYISIHYDSETAEAQELRLLLLVFWLSILISIIPFCAHYYGYWNVWCWFSSTLDVTEQQYVIYLFFYGELWISMITIVILTIGGDRNIRDEERKKSMLKFRSKLKYYPLVIIGLWLIPSFDQIASYTYDSLSITSQVLSFSHIVAFSLQGMANFFLFGLGYIRKSFVNKKEKINMEKSSMKDQCITYLDEKNEDRSREVSGESSVPSIEN